MCIAPLTARGYRYRGEHGDDPRRRYFVRDERGVRVTQLPLCILPTAAWHEMLLFRDALRADSTLAAAYATEKYRVANLVGWNKAAYAVEKGLFVVAVLTRLASNDPSCRL